MVEINFAKTFGSKVANGEKRQTIRRDRETPIKEGDRLKLYTGQYTKRKVKLLDEDPVCTEIWDIRIDWKDVRLSRLSRAPAGNRDPYFHPELEQKIWFASSPSCQQFAISEGFDDTDSFLSFFSLEYRLPFNGVLIKW